MHQAPQALKAWQSCALPTALTSALGSTLPQVLLGGLPTSPEPGRAGGARRPASWGVWLASQDTFSAAPNREMESASRRMDQV